jgi:sulfate permease, SulP family
VIVDFAERRVADQSALSAIEGVSAAYGSVGKSIRLRHLSQDCHRLLSRTGLLSDEFDDDPDYAVAADYSVRVALFEVAH